MNKPTKDEVLKWAKDCERQARHYRDSAADATTAGLKERATFWENHARSREREASDLRKFAEEL